jgi:hypothetical protein
MHEEWNEPDDVVSKVFRVELIVCGCGCNGSKTGPTIEAIVGETIVIRVVNHLAEPMSLDLSDAALPLQPASTVAPGATGEYQFLLVNSGRFSYPWGGLIVFPN